MDSLMVKGINCMAEQAFSNYSFRHPDNRAKLAEICDWQKYNPVLFQFRLSEFFKNSHLLNYDYENIEDVKAVLTKMQYLPEAQSEGYFVLSIAESDLNKKEKQALRSFHSMLDSAPPCLEPAENSGAANGCPDEKPLEVPQISKQHSGNWKKDFFEKTKIEIGLNKLGESLQTKPDVRPTGYV